MSSVARVRPPRSRQPRRYAAGLATRASRPEVASYDLPVLGPVPAPIVLLFAALAIGYVLARLVSLHAGWLGRRWAKRIGARITDAVRQRVVDELLVPLDRFEASRAALNKAVTAADDCP